MYLRQFLALTFITLGIISVTFLRLYEERTNYRSEAAAPDSPRTLEFEPLLWPGVKLGALDLSNRTLREAEELIRQYQEKETFLSFPHRIQAIKYSDLGVEFDLEALESFTRKCFLYDLTCQETAPEGDLGSLLVKVNEEKFQSFSAQLNEDVKTLLFSQDVSFEDLSFSAHDPEASIAVDQEYLRSQLTAEKIFSTELINVETRVNYPQGVEVQRTATQGLVENVTSTPLLIKYGRQPLNISPEELRSFVEIVEVEGLAQAQIKEEPIRQYLESLKSKFNLPIVLEDKEARLSVAYALLFRAGGESPQTAVILPLAGESKTGGRYSDKYLEVNKSQQRMYAFEGGELKESYIVGTGLTWETPTGEFKILRKEGMAVSYHGNWFMPYYMPIGTVYGYFFGFHEIPYRKDAAGNIASRDVNTMGSPATGGCVQLYHEDAQEIYEWSDVGMPVVIYE